MENKKDTYIKVNITSKLKEDAKKAAKKKGLTLPDYIRYQITKGIEEEDRERYLGQMVKEAMAEYKAGETVELESDEDIEEFHKKLMED